MTESAPLIALAGPTASGKTAAALAVAARWPVEIISVDSALVYRGMDIGTAKPNPQERAAAPHHLIDIRDPSQSYSAAEFCRDAAGLIDQIRARGRLPLLVGGTMLYFKAFLEGLDDMPAADPAVRAGIAQEAAELGWPALHARLAEVDPQSAARLQPQDSQRIARALEVWRVAGRPLSAFQTRSARLTPAPPHVLMSLEPRDRSWLHQRIAQRFEAMLAQGFLDEVRRLMARGDLHAELPSMRCVGYRQAWQTLQDPAGLGPAALRQLRDTGVAATRQLAKRQLTWLRAMPARCVAHADARDATQQVLQEVRKHWGAP
jgi:tRNA dimethylallyltransferase